MRSGRLIPGILSILVLLSMLSACTGPDVASDPSPGPPITFARYFFSASGIGGVLEVSSSPTSICYSTQSNAPRPISITRAASGGGGLEETVEVSYTPDNNGFCDRTEPTLVAALLSDPSGYQIHWRPRPGESIAISAFSTQVGT